MSEALVSVKHAVKTFQAGKGMFGQKRRVHAVNDVSFDIIEGETFSLVGSPGAEIHHRPAGKPYADAGLRGSVVPRDGHIRFYGKTDAGRCGRKSR